MTNVKLKVFNKSIRNGEGGNSVMACAKKCGTTKKTAKKTTKKPVPKKK